MSKAFLKNRVAGLSTESGERTLIFDGRLLSSAENSAPSPSDEAMRSATRRFRAQRTREEREVEGKEQRVAEERRPRIAASLGLEVALAEVEKCLAAIKQNASNTESAERCIVIHSNV